MALGDIFGDVFLGVPLLSALFFLVDKLRVVIGLGPLLPILFLLVLSPFLAHFYNFIFLRELFDTPFGSGAEIGHRITMLYP